MSQTWADIWPKMADTHCHPHDYPNPETSLKANLEKGLRLHQMTIHPEEYLQVSNTPLYQHPQVLTHLGLYPLEVDLEGEKLKAFLDLLPQTPYVGEIGLDYSTDHQDQIQAQKIAFETILKTCHQQGSKLLSLHSRRAGEDIIKYSTKDFSGTIILHWYSGPLPTHFQCPDHLYFSVNTAMLKSRNGKRLLENLPLSRLLLESDGPYITNNEQPVHSYQLTSVIESLAHRHQKSISDIADLLAHNYQQALQPLS